jgi:hypothetical protein
MDENRDLYFFRAYTNLPGIGPDFLKKGKYIETKPTRVRLILIDDKYALTT